MDQNAVIERYNGHVGVSGAWLAERFGKDQYDNWLKRGHIRSLRRGGNGRTALIDWQSMGTRMKGMVIALLGCDPARVTRVSLLRQAVERRERELLDQGAWEYYSHVTTKDGHYLRPEKVRELWNGARILDAIGEVLEEKERAAVMGRVKLNIKAEFAALGMEIDQNLVEYPNTLPVSGSRLRGKYLDYKLHGYGVLVHGLTGREGNNRGRSAEELAVVETLIASGAKLSDAQVSKAAGTLGVEISGRRVQEVRKRNEAWLTATRDGSRSYRDRVAMQVDRERPEVPLRMWSLDGWTAELYYQERGAKGVSYWKRLVVEVVIDVMNDYPIGYAIGEQEDAALIAEALRDAVNHSREVLGGYYAPWQIQSDHYALKTMTPKYQALAKYVTPASVGNAKAKPVERYFAYLESEYLWALSNNGGHNITARNLANDEWLNAHKYRFPDREGCEAQIRKIMEIERSRKIGAMREAWQGAGEEKRRTLNMEAYLLNFGERGRGNMLTANGIKLVRGGETYKFDCFDTSMRLHASERWTLHYDLRDMNRALAVNEEGTLRYMVEAKERVPMAIADYEEEDWQALGRYREFNARLTEERNAHVAEVRQRAEEYMTRERLESPLGALLLTDGEGRHKDNRRKLQREVTEAVFEEVPQEKPAAEKPARAREIDDIWDRL